MVGVGAWRVGVRVALARWRGGGGQPLKYAFNIFLVIVSMDLKPLCNWGPLMAEFHTFTIQLYFHDVGPSFGPFSAPLSGLCCMILSSQKGRLPSPTTATLKHMVKFV